MQTRSAYIHAGPVEMVWGHVRMGGLDLGGELTQNLVQKLMQSANLEV